MSIEPKHATIRLDSTEQRLVNGIKGFCRGNQGSGHKMHVYIYYMYIMWVYIMYLNYKISAEWLSRFLAYVAPLTWMSCFVVFGLMHRIAPNLRTPVLLCTCLYTPVCFAWGSVSVLPVANIRYVEFGCMHACCSTWNVPSVGQQH